MTLKPSPQDWHSIGTGHANTRPIQVTIPRLLKGTSTIWSQTSLGMGQSSITLAIITPLKWRHNWRSNVNHTPIPGNANLWPIFQSNANLIPICHFGWQSFTNMPPCTLFDQPDNPKQVLCQSNVNTASIHRSIPNLDTHCQSTNPFQPISIIEISYLDHIYTGYANSASIRCQSNASVQSST